MKKVIITTVALLSMVAGAAVVSAEPKQTDTSFTKEMVSGKTMVSSAYKAGSVTFNEGGTLTCNGYPKVVECKTWEIDPDGAIVRYFVDNSSGAPKPVRAVWKLIKNNGTSFRVIQTSSNSDKTSEIIVSY